MLLIAQPAPAQPRVTSRPPSHLRSRPTLYLVAAGIASTRFSDQLVLLWDQPELASTFHLVVVPVTSDFLTIGWPLGLQIVMPAQVERDLVRRRFGEVGNGHEFFAALIDRTGHLRLFSRSPVSPAQIRRALTTSAQPRPRPTSPPLR